MRTPSRRFFLAIAGVCIVVSGARAADDKRIDDSEFVKKVSCACKCEIKSSEAAVQQARDPQVKQFAQRMIDDHAKGSKELEELATRKGWALAKTPDEKQQKEIDKLSGLSGQDFDRAYVKFQVTAHQEAVKLFENESKSGQDEDLKAWATKMLPTLREHLKMITEISEKTN